MSEPEKDTLSVATGGTIPREDRCTSCGEKMLYRVEFELSVRSSSGGEEYMFCGSAKCLAFLMEVPL